MPYPTRNGLMRDEIKTNILTKFRLIHILLRAFLGQVQLQSYIKMGGRGKTMSITKTQNGTKIA